MTGESSLDERDDVIGGSGAENTELRSRSPPFTVVRGAPR
jgi:hypothetical protein